MTRERERVDYQLLNGQTRESQELLDYLYPKQLTPEDKQAIKDLQEEGYSI